MRTILISILLAAVCFAGDVTGKWSGNMEGTGPDGESHNGQALMIFKIEDGKLSGTAGTSDDNQIPLENVKLDGDKLTFEASPNGRTIKFTMALDGDSLKGEAVMARDAKTMNLKFDLKREK